MADVTKYNFLDESGVQKLAEYVLQAANSRIKERILTEVNDGSYTDVNHVLAAKVILGMVGKIADYGNGSSNTTTVVGILNGLKAAIGTAEDDSDEDTVYGAIAETNEAIETAKTELKGYISSLGHLTYKTVVGAVPSDGGFGKLLETKSITPSTEVIYLQADDDEDKTWNLYIYDGEDYMCVGDTSIDLVNYWSKDEIGDIQSAIMQKITDTTIQSKVEAAFKATDPFGSTSGNAYLQVSST